jgi:hypothetical protein
MGAATRPLTIRATDRESFFLSPLLSHPNFLLFLHVVSKVWLYPCCFFHKPEQKQKQQLNIIIVVVDAAYLDNGIFHA